VAQFFSHAKLFPKQHQMNSYGEAKDGSPQRKPWEVRKTKSLEEATKHSAPRLPFPQKLQPNLFRYHL
jgi:hypothetical protein